MLVFSSKLPLRETITNKKCLEMFFNWIENSPHYSLVNIDFDMDDPHDYDYEHEDLAIRIRFYNTDNTEIIACRFENKEKNAVWYSDCIFVNREGNRAVVIQLNCIRTNYNDKLPRIHKPYIVRLFVESGFCKEDNGIPIAAAPLKVEGQYFDICSRLMVGKQPCEIPSVYISTDYQNNTAVDPVYLAHELSGIAHVFVEENHDTALRLRESTDGNNAHNGYVGIYFPNTAFCQRHSIAQYNNKTEMAREIITSVWNTLINRVDSSTISWNQVVALKSKKEMEEWRDIGEHHKNQLSQYIASFDSENTTLREQNEELNKQVFSLRSKLDALKACLDSDEPDSLFYKKGEEHELYSGERNDLLYSILTQVKMRYEENSRAYAIIQSLINANPRVGSCERIVNAVREVFEKGGQISNIEKTKLKENGFILTEDGSHYKMSFYDNRYMFSIPKTPSDHREGKNMASDICKIINIEKKL